MPGFTLREIEPPTRSDLRHVRHQIGVQTPVAESFLIPDNHNGRATVSSAAVAHEVQAMGGRTGELTVRGMIDEARAATDHPEFAGVAPFGVGVMSGLHRRLPAWKRAANFVFVQVSFSVEALRGWGPDPPHGCHIRPIGPHGCDIRTARGAAWPGPGPWRMAPWGG